jgi:hypothetical protein
MVPAGRRNHHGEMPPSEASAPKSWIPASRRTSLPTGSERLSGSGGGQILTKQARFLARRLGGETAKEDQKRLDVGR